MATDDNNVVVEVSENRVGDHIGTCKWFNNIHGYGFLTILTGNGAGTDVFVHHSGIKTANSMYKTLKKGEYLTFDIGEGNQGPQAVNVRGILGGPLLCDNIAPRKPMGTPKPTNGWTPVVRGKSQTPAPPPPPPPCCAPEPAE